MQNRSGRVIAGYLRDLTPGFPAGLCFLRAFLKAMAKLHSLKSRHQQANPRIGESGESQGLNILTAFQSDGRRGRPI
jgi:hypothetical protein